jgi:hypothetical protein
VAVISEGEHDEGKVIVVGHLLIRDPESGEVILSRRDLQQPPKQVDEE